MNIEMCSNLYLRIEATSCHGYIRVIRGSVNRSLDSLFLLGDGGAGLELARGCVDMDVEGRDAIGEEAIAYNV